MSGIEFDAKSLAFVDADADGHIRAPEILAAVQWAGKVLKDPDHLVRREDHLPLSAIDDGTEEGKAVLGGAKLVLSVLGESEATEITLDDASDTARIFSQARFNGDGIVPAKSAEDPALAGVIEDIIVSLGGESDRGGEPGVTAETIERFYTEAKAIADWWEAVGKPETHPFDTDTAARYELFRSLKPKVEDYFQRCRLAAYDDRSTALLGPAEADYQKLAATTLRGDTEAVAGFPLAVAAAGKALPLADGLNPVYADAVRRFAVEIVVPVLGTAESLTDDGWGTICACFAPYEAWLETKPATAVEKLGEVRVRAILAEDGKAALLDLVARDKAVEPEVTAIVSVERLLRYCRDLHLLVNNFVSFRDFYTRKGKATFQAGTLYLDGRSCDLCISITDVGKHAAIATLSRVCLAYCDCVRRGGGEKMTIAAAFTAGDSDFLTVGRNGVFYDRRGQDWDATIVRILEHPISVRQAFWAPYKRLARLIGEQIAEDGRGTLQGGGRPGGAAGDIGDAEHGGGEARAPASAPLRRGEVRRHLRGDRPGDRRHRHHARRRPDGDPQAHLVADPDRHRGDHPGDLPPLGAPRLAEAPEAEHRPDPGRQRVGGERAREDQHPVRDLADRRRAAAGERGAVARRPVRGEETSVETVPGSRGASRRRAGAMAAGIPRAVVRGMRWVRRGHPFTLPIGSRRTTRRLSPARTVAETTSSTFL